MLILDQKYRWMIMLGELDENKLKELKTLNDNDKSTRFRNVLDNKTGISQFQKDSLGLLQSEIDNTNFTNLSNIIHKYGYPKKYIKSYKISTIFLHSDPHLMSDSFLNVLFDEVKNKNMPALDYAIIYDKVQLENKYPERYYVLEHFNPLTHTSECNKPGDIAVTNKARKEIGLKKIRKQY